MKTILKFATVILVVMMFVGGHYLAMDYINQVENMEYEKVSINSTNNYKNHKDEYLNTSIKNSILSEDYIKYSKSLMDNGTSDEKMR